MVLNKSRLTWQACCDGYEDVALKNGVTVGEAICQLCDYENTGLTPKGVLELQEKYKNLKQQCKQIIG